MWLTQCLRYFVRKIAQGTARHLLASGKDFCKLPAPLPEQLRENYAAVPGSWRKSIQASTMGNTMSMQREPEDDEPVHITAYSEVSSEPPENLKNGPVTIATVQTVPSANGDAVDARVSVVQDNVAVSSQKTMELSSSSEASGNNLGKEAKAAPPAAKSRFVFAFSRPVPGRTEEKAANASAGSAQLDVSSEAPQANKALSENVDLPAAAATEEASDKNLREESLSEIELTAPGKAEEEDAALSKPKELSFSTDSSKWKGGKTRSKHKTKAKGR
ncbi:Hypothetical predicted protein [Podarcis lilfordi]|uniref:Uncharacterized protein n=1 Tax=Podarcis lilfordi TaxID=74358 RepID=A0AA35KHG6_9SAUR|nr:Hypothetical predicted protein [Podarcis lilfordi]